jgi:MoaA/NifB/PqqE/SkfB family radical SAM enzyme
MADKPQLTIGEPSNLIKYRDDTLNSKSESFCGAKWGNSTIWLHSGKTTSCHHPSPHDINIDDIAKDPSMLHNTREKMERRLEMQVGKRPRECQYCWKVEDMGKDYVSDRIYKSLQFSEEEMSKWYDAPHTERVVPPTIEVSFSRTCNFACTYCNADFSTEWRKDIRKNGGYDMETHGGKVFMIDGDENNPYERLPEEDNPYTKAWWEWWPELSKGLQTLRITGGEPLMSNDVWKLFAKVKEEGHTFEVGLNSNLGAKPALINRLIEESHGMPNLTLFSSNETVGKEAEYIRWGLKYDYWKENMERVFTESNIKRTVVMMTINALCLFNITKFLTQVITWKHQYPNKSIGISINFLRFPACQSMMVLPMDIRHRLAQEIEDWYLINKDDRFLNAMEKGDIERLINYIRTVERGHDFADPDMKANIRDFKRFYTQYDMRRDRTIDVFPQYFLDWYNSIDTEIPERIGAVNV